MKSVNIKFISVIMAALAAVSCNPNDPQGGSEISVTPETLSFVAASPASRTLNIKSGAEWKAECADSWITLSPKSGKGNSSVTVSAEANIAPEGAAAAARSSVIDFTIEGKKVSVNVSQEAETLVFAVEGSPTKVDAAGASVNVKVEANMTYTIASSADWCVLAEGASTKAVKTDNLKFVVAENTAAAIRKATITVTPAAGVAQSISITQAGSGAEEQPDGVANAEEFKAFVAALEKGDLSDIDLDGDKVINLFADIDAGTLAAPLATLPAGYTFDGRNHKITYSFENQDPDILDLGLFSKVEGTVKNLNVEGSVKDSAPAASRTIHVGGLTGVLGSDGVLENCSSAVNVLAVTMNTQHMGGLAGYAEEGATVKDCTNTGDVKMTIPDLGSANASQLGGIIGHIECSATIDNCENKGTVAYEGKGTPRIAGIVGYLNNLMKIVIKDSKNSGDVVWNEGDYSADKWSYVGGITGYNGTPKEEGVLTIEGCAHTGNVICNIHENSSKVRVGGIMSHGGSNTTIPVIYYNIINCTNSGNMKVTIGASNKTYAGGIVGFAEKNATVAVEGCTFSGTLESLGGAQAGAIIGSTCGTASTIKNVTVTKDAVLKSENGFKSGCVGMLGGYNSKYTTAVTGKVAGTIIDGGSTFVLTQSNYKDFLFGQPLGEGGNTDGVTFAE